MLCTECGPNGWISHSLGVVSLVSVYDPTEVTYLTVKDAFYAVLESVVDKCPRRDTLLVLGDLNASTGTDRDSNETCVGPHGPGTVNQNSTKFLDFARSHGLRVADSWFQPPTGLPLDLVFQRWWCGKGD